MPAAFDLGAFISCTAASKPITSFPARRQRQIVESSLFIRGQLLFENFIYIIGNSAFQTAFQLSALPCQLKAFPAPAEVRAASRFLSGEVYGELALLAADYPHRAFFSYHFTAAYALTHRNVLFLHGGSLFLSGGPGGSLSLCGRFLCGLLGNVLGHDEILGSYLALSLDVDLAVCELSGEQRVLTLVADRE